MRQQTKHIGIKGLKTKVSEQAEFVLWVNRGIWMRCTSPGSSKNDISVSVTSVFCAVLEMMKVKVVIKKKLTVVEIMKIIKKMKNMMEAQ